MELDLVVLNIFFQFSLFVFSFEQTFWAQYSSIDIIFLPGRKLYELQQHLLPSKINNIF